jgi:putative ABC transport system permease protein
VVIVNEAFVRRFLPDVDPLAQRLAMESFLPEQKRSPKLEWQVVGVSADVRNADLRSTGDPEIIVPFWQSPWPQTRMAVRIAGEPMGIYQGLAAAIRSVDPICRWWSCGRCGGGRRVDGQRPVQHGALRRLRRAGAPRPP